MIKANELRIGNIVSYLGKETVANVVSDGFVSTLKSGSVTIMQVDGIPLTEGWLLRFGFHYTNDEWIVLFWINGRIIFTIEYTGKIFIEAKTRVHIKHVHQLQNLFFALTGDELTLKQ